MSVLALDIAGTPRAWISYDDAITKHAKNDVAWSLGSIVARYRGGIQNDGRESYIETPSIIAVRGKGFEINKHGRVLLSNRTLFGRDRNVCAYCGEHFPNSFGLSRDHIVPRSRGGTDVWMNVVTSCKRCNTHKGNKTLKEARLELIYLPYVPNYYEQLIIMNRNILADQMEYLVSGLPKNSRIIY